MQYKVFNLVVLLWICSCSFSFAASNEIVAGRSIGHIRLGKSAKQATGSVGAVEKEDAGSGHFWQVWVSTPSHSSKRYELDVFSVRDESGLHVFVEQVRVTSPWFATCQGIRVGSSLSTALAAFPNLRRVNPDKTPTNHQKIALYDDVNQGITFEFASAKHGVPGSTKCRAILVHPKRRSVFAENYTWYMPIDNGMLRYAL